MKNLLLILGFLLLGVAPSFSADLDTIIRRGKLIVAVKNNLPPLAFLDSQGNLQGLEIDIAKRLASEILGSDSAIILKPVSNQELYRWLLMIGWIWRSLVWRLLPHVSA